MKEYTFTVKGMACSMCESHINDAIYKIDGVKKVKSYRRKHQTVVTAEDLNTESVLKAVRDLGYDIDDSFTEKEAEKKSLFGKRKR